MSIVTKDIDSNISISILTIKAQEHTRPTRSVSFYINEEDRKLGWELKEERTFEATFEPSLDISPSDRLKFVLRRSYQLGSRSWFQKTEEIRINASQILDDSRPGTLNNSREWQYLVNGTEITTLMTLYPTIKALAASTSQILPALDNEHHGDLSASLIPTTDDIARICPRFRILLVGKSGVGKSSLINQTFGVEIAQVSEFEPGKANIHEGIESKKNPRFVLHDSQGFEPGELSNFRTVADFIQTRNRMPDLKDKLHAIWLCLAIPTAGGRVLETGVENLLRLKQKGALGEVPIIIVWTKYDQLVMREDRKLDNSLCEGLSEEEVSQLVDNNARAALMRDCILPLEKSTKTKILSMAVSITERYHNTLLDLIQITFNHVAKEASIVAAIAQKVNPNVKVEGSIEVGRSKYWSGLASSANFPGKRLLECLDVIHTDIIAVWDFEDPNMNLQSKEFKALMSNMVTEVSVSPSSHPNRGLGVGFSVVATVAGVVSSLAGPAAPIVIPIAAGLVLAKWLFDVYQNSRQTLERIMAYIIDLTLVMQHVFCLVQGEHSVTSRRIIKLAYSAYYNSSLKSRAHSMITEHVKQTKPLPGSRDITIDKIVEIIGLFRMDSIEISNLQQSIGQPELLGRDEPWRNT